MVIPEAGAGAGAGHRRRSLGALLGCLARRALLWAEAVAVMAGPLAPEVVHLPDPKLAGRLPKADRLVIDCSPRDHRITDAAITVADLVVILSATTSADMDRTWATLDLAAQLGTTAGVLLVKVRSGTRSLANAIDAMAAERVTVLAARIPQARGPGRGVGPAAHHRPLRLRPGRQRDRGAAPCLTDPPRRGGTTLPREVGTGASTNVRSTTLEGPGPARRSSSPPGP